MSGRTVTVETWDYGPVTVPEPAWCLADHEDGGNRADITHEGREHAVAFPGTQMLLASLVEYPFAERLWVGPGIAVDTGKGFMTLDSTRTRELAAALIDHAATLRNLARQLDALAEGGRS